MTKRSILPQHPRHILIYDEDWEFLQAAYGPHSEKKLGVSVAVRTIIHSYIKRLRANAEATVETTVKEATQV